MEMITKIFESNYGYARMNELKEAGVHTRTISAAVKEGIIEKVKPGLYKLVNYPFDENESFATICRANKRAVICLLSAASYYHLTTYDPPEIYTAVPHNTHKFEIDYPPVKVYYFVDKYYLPGIADLETGSGIIKIYNREKTIIDLFRYKNKLGEDMALEALKTYMRRKDRRVNILANMAEQLGIYKKMEAYIKGAI